jgi:alkanesulfonate monooxygenase SsuD/methylene tetrahydromethanopterin reductase-like flavin-dependent oxidoreductase (luciferase family)
VQRPHPPILIGGLSGPALHRVAKHGSGWLAVTASPKRLEKSLGILKRLMTENGRRFRDLSLTYKMFIGIDQRKQSRFDSREPGTGTVAEIIDDLKRIFALGFKRVIVRYRGQGRISRSAISIAS